MDANAGKIQLKLIFNYTSLLAFYFFFKRNESSILPFSFLPLKNIWEIYHFYSAVPSWGKKP